MENFLIFILFGVIFLNLLISVCIIIKRRKKEVQYSKNIAILFDKIEILENNVKKSFNEAASHTNSVRNKLDESNEKLRHDIKLIRSLLQELKEETSSNSGENISNHNELRHQIENIETKVKRSFNEAASHTNSVKNKLDESNKELNHNIKLIDSLLQKLKEESYSKKLK